MNARYGSVRLRAAALGGREERVCDSTVYQIGDVPKPDCKYKENQMDHPRTVVTLLNEGFHLFERLTLYPSSTYSSTMSSDLSSVVTVNFNAPKFYIAVLCVANADET